MGATTVNGGVLRVRTVICDILGVRVMMGSTLDVTTAMSVILGAYWVHMG